MMPAQLVKAVSIALDVSEETVVQHDRNLAVAGLRSTGARGRHAPHMTPLDAARLLVATLGSIRTKDSVATVRKFESTKFDPPKSMAEMMAEMVGDRWPEGLELPAFIKEWAPSTDKFSDPAIDALPQTHNFIEAVTALISDASAPVEDVDQHLRRFAEIVIQIGSRVLSDATIGRIGQGNSAGYNRSWSKASTKKPVPPEQPQTPRPRYQLYARNYGIRQQRDIYGSAIMLLGKAFRDGGLPFETTKDALDALLGSKKGPTKAKKRVE